MHYTNHNFTSHDFETKYMSRIEKTIYLDLRSIYLSDEKPIDGSDMELLERRLSVIDDAEKQALAFVLKDKFNKTGKLFKHAEWDKIIKDYKFQQISLAVGDMAKRLKLAGKAVEANAGTPTIRALYITNFGHDKLTRITNANETANAKANDESESTNETANALTNAERQAKSKAERKHMVDNLKAVGEKVTLKTGISTLRELYSKHFNSDATLNMANANANNETANANANGTNESETETANESNGRKDAITINQKLETNNHKPISERDTHTNTGEGIIDNFGTDVVDNSADNFTGTTQPTETIPPVTESVIAQYSVNQPATKADQIRDQRADDIESWKAPTFKEMQDQLLAAGKQMNFTGTQYRMHVEDFKAHYAEQALLGKPVSTEANRKAKLRKWLMGEIDKQTANQARQEKARGTFNIDNEDWSGTTASNPTQSNSDMPDVFHPSHSKPATQAKPNPKTSVMVNGLWREPLPSMTVAETYEYITQQHMPGEMQDETYDRLLNQMQEA